MTIVTIAARIVVIRCAWCRCAQGELSITGDGQELTYFSRCKMQGCRKWFRAVVG